MCRAAEAAEVILNGWYVLTRFEEQADRLVIELTPDIFDSEAISPKFQIEAMNAIVKPSFKFGVGLIGNYIMQIEKAGNQLIFSAEYGDELFVIGGAVKYSFVERSYDDLIKIISSYEKRCKDDAAAILKLRKTIDTATAWIMKSVDRTERLIRQGAPNREKYEAKLSVMKSLLEVLSSR